MKPDPATPAQPTVRVVRRGGLLLRILDWVFEGVVFFVVAGVLLYIGLVLSQRGESSAAGMRGTEAGIKLAGWAKAFDDRTALSTMLDTGAMNSPSHDSGYCLLRIKAGRMPHLQSQVALIKPGVLYSVSSGDTVRRRRP
jgi:hypothetical protein